MKLIIRNIIIFLFYLTSIPFWRRWFLGRPLLRVWCLHEVKDEQVGRFRKKIDYLKRHFNIISPQQFLEQELSIKKLNLLLTFDDGFQSWFANVLPVLEKEKIKAIFFVNQAFYSQAGQLTADGHWVGGHSSSHKRLTEINSSELEKEVWQSEKSEFFAYPYGDKQSFNCEVIDEVKKAGFKKAFTILPGFNNKKTNPWLLHRDALDADTADWVFKLWLKGCYDWIKRVF